MHFPTLARRVDTKKTCNGQQIAFVIITVFFCVNADGQFKEAALTCSFFENVSERQQEFSIAAEQSDGPETALKCYGKNEGLYCIVSNGYSFDWRVSDTVTVRRGLHLGPQPTNCSCFLVDFNKTSYERPCSVQATSPEDSIPEPSEQRRKSEEKGSFIRTRNSESDDMWITVSVSLSGVGMFLLIASLAIYLHVRCRRLKDVETSSNSASKRLII